MPRRMTQAQFDAQRSRGWVFTINNYTDDDVQKVLSLSTKVEYMIAGYEVGKEGTPHIQGYMYRRNPIRGKTCRLALPRASLEKARADALENYAYCSKDNNLLAEAGTPPQKNGGDSVAEKAEKNVKLLTENLRDLIDAGEVSALAGPAVVRARLAYRQAAPEFDPSKECKRGVWIFGKSGVGKSRWVRSTYDDQPIFQKPQDKWWCDYAGEKIVLLDDLDTDTLGHYLKLWADVYPVSGSVKNMAPIKLQHEKFIVTSNWSIEELFREKPMFIEPIVRRFEVLEFQRGESSAEPVIVEHSSPRIVELRDEWGSLRN